MPSTLRKKKDQERKTRSREALIDAAARVFCRHGYHNTLIADIVKEAGFGQGTFYRYFAGKREIFEVIFDRFASELLGQFNEMSEHLPTNLAQYRESSLRAVRRVVSLLERNRQVVLLFLREATAVDREFEEKLAGLYERLAGLAGFYLDHAISKGFARPCRSEVVAQSLVGVALRLADLWWRGAFPELSREQIIEEIVDFAFLGFGAPTGGEAGAR